MNLVTSRKLSILSQVGLGLKYDILTRVQKDMHLMLNLSLVSL